MKFKSPDYHFTVQVPSRGHIQCGRALKLGGLISVRFCKWTWNVESIQIYTSTQIKHGFSLLIIGVPNLHVVETVNSERLASHLNNCWGKLNKPPLKVMVQLNTSHEESKYLWINMLFILSIALIIRGTYSKSGVRREYICRLWWKYDIFLNIWNIWQGLWQDGVMQNCILN